MARLVRPQVERYTGDAIGLANDDAIFPFAAMKPTDQSLQSGRRHRLHPAQRAAPESRGEGAEEEIDRRLAVAC